MEQFLSKNSVYLSPFCINASNENRSSDNRIFFLILHAILQKVELRHLENQIPYNYHRTIEPFLKIHDAFLKNRLFKNVSLFEQNKVQYHPHNYLEILDRKRRKYH